MLAIARLAGIPFLRRKGNLGLVPGPAQSAPFRSVGGRAFPQRDQDDIRRQVLLVPKEDLPPFVWVDGGACQTPHPRSASPCDPSRLPPSKRDIKQS